MILGGGGGDGAPTTVVELLSTASSTSCRGPELPDFRYHHTASTRIETHAAVLSLLQTSWLAGVSLSVEVGSTPPGPPASAWSRVPPAGSTTPPSPAGSATPAGLRPQDTSFSWAATLMVPLIPQRLWVSAAASLWFGRLSEDPSVGGRYATV